MKYTPIYTPIFNEVAESAKSWQKGEILVIITGSSERFHPSQVRFW
jgi:hypothetical protein